MTTETPTTQRRRFRKKRYWMPTAAVVGLVALAAVTGPDKETAAAPAEAAPATQAETPQPTTTEAAPAPAPKKEEAPAKKAAPAPKPKAENVPAAPKVDSGRFDQGEADLIAERAAEFAQESGEVSEAMPRCAVFLASGEMAATSDCIEEAISGFEEDADALALTLETKRDDAAGDCQRKTDLLALAVRRYSAAMVATAEAAASFGAPADGGLELERAGEELGEQSDAFLLACAPDA